MELVSITFFLAVAEAGGISRAAATLHTVQSNISTRIRSLESELGVALFRRHARGVVLTEAGEAFLPYARRMVSLMREATRAVGDDAEPTGTLALGSMESTAGIRLPDVLAAFTRDCPQVDVTLTTGTTRELIDMVVAHRVDGAFVSGPVDDPQLLCEVTFVEELTLITAGRTTTVADAFDATTRMLVLRNGCAYRERLHQLFREHGVDQPQFLEFGSIEGILGCVAAGMGITLLPVVVAADSRCAPRLNLHRLPAREACVETLFIRRADAPASTAVNRFLGHVRASAAAERPAAPEDGHRPVSVGLPVPR